MMPTMLTAAAVRKMKAAPKRNEVHDAGCRGLTLVIEPSGHKSWKMRFRGRQGKLVRLTLGVVDVEGEEISVEPVIGTPLTLLAARRLAADINRRRAFGEDVIGKAHRERLERKIGGSKAFDQAAMDFVEHHVLPKLRRPWSYAKLLGVQQKGDGTGFELIPKGLADRWRGRLVTEIEGDDIFSIVSETRLNGTPGINRRNKTPSEPRARTMFAILSKLFAWLVQQRRAKINPCLGVHKPDAPKSRDRVLTDSEIVAFWKASDKAATPFGPALKILLLTGCRLNEVAGMRRGEISDDGKVWTIPGERTKNHRTHVVPLSRLVQQILADVKTVGEHVFTTDAAGVTHISGWSKTKARLDALMVADLAGRDAWNGGKAIWRHLWRLHDLRRTCATGMAEIGIPPHIVEACLNYLSGAKAGVAGTYNRATYAAEKRIAFERWTEQVERLVMTRTATVIQLV